MTAARGYVFNFEPVTCLCFTYWKVDPSEVWLRSEQDRRAFFLDDSGHFNLQEAHLLFGAVLGVEGPRLFEQK